MEIFNKIKKLAVNKQSLNDEKWINPLSFGKSLKIKINSKSPNKFKIENMHGRK